MTPLEDDEVRGEVQEILSKIDAEHERGGHVTGPVAGCSICARVQDAADFTVEELARLRITQTPVPARPEEPGVLSSEARGLKVLVGGLTERLQAIRAGGEETLGDLALQDAQQALDDLEDLAQRGIVVPNAQQAIAHALIGAVKALVSIDETLRRLATVVGDASEKYVDTPPPAA